MTDDTTNIPTDEIECDECGAHHAKDEDCLTCDCCGDEMHVATNCLGQAECCIKHDNICNDCARYDSDKGIIVCSECDK